MKKDNKIVNFIASFSSIALIVLTISLIYSLFKINIVNNILLIVIGIVLILIDILFIIHMENKNKNKYTRYVVIFISLIFVFLYTVGISYSILTANFVNNITKENDEYQTFYVMISNNDNRKTKELNNKIIGFVENISSDDSIKDTLSKKASISFDALNYKDDASLINSYVDKKIDAFVIGKNYLEELKENNINIFDGYKIIYKYKVKIKKNVYPKTELKRNDPFILYISGSDSRGSIKNTARSDVNILAVVNPSQNKILLISIPRDYYVQLHGTMGVKDKLTHAGVYGIQMSKNTIEDLLGIEINYYLKVGFDAVINSVDLIDGIDIYSDKEFIAYTNNNCKFIEGTQHVDGKCALAFSRERYAYESGDRHRGENQEQVISKILEKVATPSLITKYTSILKSLDGSFETDMSYEEITSLIKNEILSLEGFDVKTYNLDGTGASMPTYSMGAQKLYVMIPNENTISQAKTLITEYLQK